MQITLHSVINRLDEQEIYDVDEPGSLTIAGDARYLRYTQAAPEPKLPETKMMLKLADDGSVKMRQSGILNTQFQFTLDHLTHTNYHTPAGNIILDIKTTALTQETTNQGGTVNIAYQLIENESPLGDYQMQITYTF
ncbi:DUF1934 domain-containing protein [Weissella uvarum]|uniref:DUF1934 family protein n=1 Tax=Weissella uvarum TaxID=1479233 RepID=UPI00195FF2E2|nr:DUF1934 domain-containing protein [Weissella uvarum]